MAVVNYWKFQMVQCHIDIESSGNWAVDDGKWPIHVDLSQVVMQVPALKDMDKEREAREEIFKKKERELRKDASADDMTVAPLREVLDEMNVTYRKNEKNWADSVWKVKKARSTAIDATQDCDGGSEHTPKSSRKTPKLKWPIAYCYSDKRNVFNFFCCIFYFFRHNWHLHRIFSLYVCDLCFKHG